MSYLLLFLLVVIWRQFQLARNPRHPLQLNVYFGVPGSGKTTFAAYLARWAQRESIVIRLCRRFPCRFTCWILDGSHWKRPIRVLSNVPIKGTYKVDCKKDIGKYAIDNCKLIIDEAGVDFNSRQYKSLSMDAIEWFKYHRHCGVSVDVFSQSYEDMDITLRRLAQHFYVVKRSLIPYFVTVKLIRRKVGIDNNTHQICDAYSFGVPVLDTKRIFCPPLWKMFNTYDHKELPEKEWQLWDDVAAV